LTVCTVSPHFLLVKLISLSAQYYQPVLLLISGWLH